MLKTMSRSFEYDVYLCYGSMDKPAVRELAELLRKDGLRVWFDEWEIQLGDLVPKRVQYGLQNSRTLLLFMSPNAFVSGWVELEHYTAIFRNPSNSERRLIPLLLVDTEIPEMLQPIMYVDWRNKDPQEYQRLLKACRTPERPHGGAPDNPPDELATISPAEGTPWRSAPERLPAHLVEQSDSRTLPLDVSSAWGLDRSSFLGLIAGRADNGVYAALLRTEVALWKCLQKSPGRPALPVRWWLRIVPGFDAPETLDQIWDSVEDQKNDRLVYLRRRKVDASVLLGLFFGLSAHEAQEFPRTLLAWIDAIPRLLPSHPVALVFNLPTPDPGPLSVLGEQLRRHAAKRPARVDVLCLLPQPETETVQAEPLPAHLAVLLPDVASRLATENAGPMSEESRFATEMIQSLDAREDRPPGAYRELLEWARKSHPSWVVPMLRVGARSPCYQGRRESLVFATRADAWISAWLAAADLSEPSTLVELAAPADPESGIVVDPLALSLLRRIDREGETGTSQTLFKALFPRFSRELRTVAQLHRGDLPVDDFLNTSGPREHRLAVRAGLAPWPSRGLLACLDLDRLDLWRLLTALPLDSSRIEDVLSLQDPARRAIFGLCSASEWAAIRADSALERLVLGARQGRPLVFP